MSWIFLFVAGFFEITWAIGLKYSSGFTHIMASVLNVLGMIASFYFFALSLEHIPLGTAYAVWTGIGIVGTTILGIVLFNDPCSIWRLICMFLIVGIIGLKLLSA